MVALIVSVALASVEIIVSAARLKAPVLIASLAAGCPAPPVTANPLELIVSAPGLLAGFVMLMLFPLISNELIVLSPVIASLAVSLTLLVGPAAARLVT